MPKICALQKQLSRAFWYNRFKNCAVYRTQLFDRPDDPFTKQQIQEFVKQRMANGHI